MAYAAQQIHLVQRPQGMPVKEDFAVVKSDLPNLQANQVLLKTLYISVDPYMRGRMSDAKSYVPPYELNRPIEGGVVAQVEDSTSDSLRPGDIVLTDYGWQTAAVVDATRVRKIDPDLAPITTFLGILGMTGFTAYFGLLDIGQPKAGETIVVSGAAGAVGSVVGQLAKIHGARAVGIAGSHQKCDDLVENFGFDAALNYRDGNFRQALKEACPNGVDVYFDNVGGEISDLVMTRLNTGARIPICGQIALYNLQKLDVGPRIQSLLLVNRALMKGFIVSDYAARFGEAAKGLGGWLKEGKLTYRETVIEGFEHTIDAFLGLFSGENTGKQLVKVADRG